MKKWLLAILLLVISGLGYVFYQYQQIAAEADEQVEADIKLLEQEFRAQTSEALTGLHEQDNYVQTQLAFQHINAEQLYVRVYQSLFIKNGKRSCLQSHIVYQQKQPKIHQQIWLEESKNCLP